MDMSKTEYLPLLPLRDIVVFPGMIAPLFVGRDKSIKALNEVMKTNKKIILVTQKNAEIDDPSIEDLYSFGCESKILQLLKLPDGTVKVLVEGVSRVKIIECKNEEEFLRCSTEVVNDKIDSKENLLALSTLSKNKNSSLRLEYFGPINNLDFLLIRFLYLLIFAPSVELIIKSAYILN